MTLNNEQEQNVAVASRQHDVAGSQPALSLEHNNEWTREQRVLVLLVWLGSLMYCSAMAVADPDLWGHTLYGLRAIDQGLLAEPLDPFSYTAPAARWVNHEWLTEYQFGWLWRFTGQFGLLCWRNAMLLIVFSAGLWALYRARASLAASVLLLVFTAETLAGFATFIRPQLATFALLAVTLAILRRHWDRPTRWIWILPVLIGLWVNLHGGFLAGVGVIGAFVAGAWVRAFFHEGHKRFAAEMTAMFLVCLLATTVNPYGIEMHSMLWSHLAPKQAVREWQPLWGAWQSPMYYVPFVLLVIAFAASRSWRWIDLLIAVVVTQQAVSHIRHVALLAIALLILAPGPLSDALARLFPRLREMFQGEAGRFRRRLAVASVLIGLAALQLPATVRLWREGVPPWQIAVECRRDAPGVPLRAVTFLRRENVQGNMITAYSWGQYMLWHLFPDFQVAFDGRYRTVYPPELEDDFLTFWTLDETSGPRAAMLDDYPTEIALLPASSSACRYLRSRDDWAELMVDEQAAVFVKRIDRFADVIQRVERGQATPPAVAAWERFPAAPTYPGGSLGWAPPGLFGPPAQVDPVSTTPVSVR